MLTHIAHICLCLRPLHANQRQSQKSAIINALLKIEFQNIFLFTFRTQHFD